MRLATLIIALILMFIAGLQSCAVAVGGGVAAELSTSIEDEEEAEALAGAGGLGVMAALLWLVGAALVMSRPKPSMWIFGVAALFWLLAGTAGFSDAFIWMAASLAFALMSWRGISELSPQPGVQVAGFAGTWPPGDGGAPPPPAGQATTAGPPPGWYPNPQGPGLRYWNGHQWTSHIHP
jgi:hypothetical protein